MSTDVWVMQKLTVYSSQTEWNLLFVLIRSTLSHPEAARLAFDLVTSLVAEGPSQNISVDNFHGLVQLLEGFIQTAGASVESQQQRTRRREPSSQPPTPQVERGKHAIDLLLVLKVWLTTADLSVLPRSHGVFPMSIASKKWLIVRCSLASPVAAALDCAEQAVEQCVEGDTV